MSVDHTTPVPLRLRPADLAAMPATLHTPATPPMVSVLITTYNSAATLPAALDSVLDQVTGFAVEVLVADDCSSDATLEIARSYRMRFPGVLRVLERDRNVGIMRNYREGFAAASARYLAWLDADDYWTDPHKLARQVAAMEADPTIGLCAHPVRWVTRTADGGVRVERARYPEDVPAGRYGLSAILERNFVPSPAIVFRKGVEAGLPAWYLELAPVTDWPVHVLAAQWGTRGDASAGAAAAEGAAGGILMLDEVMADYTLTPTSAFWSKGSEQWYINDIRFYEKVPDLVPARFHAGIRAQQALRYERLSRHRRGTGSFAGAREAAWQALKLGGLQNSIVRRLRLLAAALLRRP